MAEIKNTISFTKQKHKFQQDGSPLNNKEINTIVQILWAPLTSIAAKLKCKISFFGNERQEDSETNRPTASSKQSRRASFPGAKIVRRSKVVMKLLLVIQA